jgi:hypothetical protein
LFLCSSVSRHSMKFAAACFIIESSVKMCWHELHDTPVISQISSLVRWRSARTAWRTFSTFWSALLVERRPQRSWSSTDWNFA